ncbi:MAG TPA: choice-of-anchor tandem repeat GloVer-containing protein [Chthoniobacterales bacterium]|nr:choice-of-anchor tandem repeat GloVer-containing protein [Chthoniobacterales bacterium]
MMPRLFFSGLLSLLIASLAVAQTPGTSYEILALGGTNGPGVRPLAGLVLGPDGNYYGTASDGGAFGGGAVFKFTPGGELSALVSFPYEQGHPSKALIVGSDGNLYGTTEGAFAGTPNSTGTIFRVTLAGQLTILATFVNTGSPVVGPQRLMESSDGNFYGTTVAGGAQKKGQVFRLTKDGTLTILAEFTGSNGAFPQAGLIEAADGNLYGTTSSGGTVNNGTVFRVTKAGVITVLASFGSDASIGDFPQAELTQGPDGNLYGVTSSRGANFGGAVFRITLGGILTLLAPLPQSNVAAPSPLVLGDDGNFYGTTVNNYYRVSLAGNLTVLANFNSAFDGRQAEGPLLKLGNGDFLGTTYSGGTIGQNDLGTIQRLTEQGAVTPVVAFPRMMGLNFNSELTEGPDGLLYGTVADSGRRTSPSRIPAPFKMSKTGSLVPLRSFSTSLSSGAGLKSSPMIPAGAGVLLGSLSDGGVLGLPPFQNARASGFIYRIAPTGSVAQVYQFIGVGNPGDGPSEHGETPDGALTSGPDSLFYGTTAFGGAQARGTIFKTDTDGNLTTLASFNSATGLAPRGKLIFDNGLFYGRTTFGGANNTGTFFSATPEGAITAIASFPAGTSPNSLIRGTDGNFYGTTFNGGANNLGTVFRLTKSGTLTTFASMDATTGNGPLGVIEAIDGNFYGVTAGNFQVPGGIFQLTRDGILTSLFRFDAAHGTDPAANLMQASDGHLYRTTAGNGPSHAGVVYRVVLPRKPLLNISTRVRVLTGENVLIGGFIISGTDPKKVIVRGIGPSLSGVGIAEPLADPTLELHQGDATLAMNDDWKLRTDGGSQQAEIEATGLAPANAVESALVATLNPGSYTVILAGKNQGSGIGVVEVYDLGQGAGSTLANISSRGFVDAGDDAMIGGLIVGGGSGGGSANVFVRGIGPSLSGAGVSGPLQDPTLEFRNSSGTLLAANDDWKVATDGSSQQGKIEATTVAPTNDLESAILLAVPSGNYTAVLRAKGNTAGVAVVEVYALP